MVTHIGTGRVDVLVMAAGLGSRYGSLKQLEPVGPSGELLLDYALYDARRAGVARAVFVISRPLEREFRETVGKRWERRLDIEYAFQDLDALPAPFQVPPGRTKPWGTGHAVLAGAEAIQAPFIAINADDFHGAEGYKRLADFLREPAGGPPERHAMVAFALRNTLSEHGTVARGVCETTAEGLLRSVTEYTAIEQSGDGIAGRVAGEPSRRFTGDEPVSVNLWGFRPSLFGQLAERFERFLAESGSSDKAEMFLPAVVSELVRGGKATVTVFPTSARWLGMTYRKDRPIVAEALRELHDRGEYPGSLWG